MIIRLLRRLFLLLFLLGIGAAIYGYKLYQQSLNAPLQASGAAILHVAKGSNINRIAHDLQAHGLQHPWALILHARLNGGAAQIKAGDYRIEPNMSTLDLLNNLQTGKVIVLQFQIIEGKRSADLLRQIAATTELKHELSGKSEAEIAAILGINGSLEGQFLPDTYHFHYGDSDIDLLKHMHQALQNTLAQAWETRAAKEDTLNSPYEALILASIIEKETGIAGERAQISGVFHRRLQQNMRLQTDPTVIYGIGEQYQGNLTRRDLQTDTPYNTYTRYGLPPTPIALASAASIKAALNPQAGDSLYFVANGTGGHTFSATYQEHQKAVQTYRRSQKESP